jgi:hypothetical protein
MEPIQIWIKTAARGTNHRLKDKAVAGMGVVDIGDRTIGSEAAMDLACHPLSSNAA